VPAVTNLTTPQTSDVVGLTTFKESATVIEKADSHIWVDRPWSRAFSAYVPEGFLKRSYLLKTFDWVPGMTVQNVPLIGALASSTAAVATFKLYRLARCTFKIRIEMTSNQYLQGSLIVGWLPCVVSNPPTDEQSLSGYNAIVLSACSQDSATLCIPYLSPRDWMDTTTFSGTTREHATVFIGVQATLLSSNPSVTAVVHMQVYGSIETCDLSGAISQMSKVTNANERADIEAKRKATESKDAAVGSTIRGASQLARRIPMIGEVWSPIADFINSVFGTELSKPVNNSAPTNVLQNYYSDINQSNGLTEASYLSLYNNPRVAVGPTLFGMESSYMSLRKFAGTPLLHDAVTFDYTTISSWSEYCRPDTVGADTTNPDYLAVAMRFSKFWRGSIKFLFHFIMPAFYSSRFQIRLQFATTVSNTGDVPSMIFDVKGDTKIKISIPYVNYFTWSDKAYSAGTHDLDPTIVVTQLTPIVGAPTPTTAVIYCQIYRAGGEDMSFAVLDDPASPARLYKARKGHTDLSLAKAQMDIKKEFSVQFPPLSGGEYFTEECHAVMSERIDNLIDILKRATTGYTATSAFGNTSTTSLHKLIMASFLWQRGSLVYRHIHLGNTSTHNDGWYLVPGASTTKKLEFGWAPAYNTATALCQTEACVLPWYCAQPYFPTNSSQSKIDLASKASGPVGITLSLSTPDTVTITAGDDFMALYLVPWAGLIAYKNTPNNGSPSSKTQ